MNHGTKFCRLCLKPLLPTILTPSFPYYPYQKDERALTGYLLTRCSFSLSDIKRLSLSPRCFLFTSTLILSFLTLSLSLCSSFSPVGKFSASHFTPYFLFESTLNLSFISLFLRLQTVNAAHAHFLPFTFKAQTVILSSSLSLSLA
jgi:hypothetical protein